jgi:adenylate kinase family enzyme
MIKKIHVMGAPGAGTSTIGRAIAQHLNIPHFDTDDFVWYTNDALPYRRRRNTDHRLQLLTETLSKHTKYVLSGSMLGWGTSFAELSDLVVYLHAPAQVRTERIRTREVARYGEARIAEGGDLYGVFTKFVEWAESYHTMPIEQLRGERAEIGWFESLICSKCAFDTQAQSVDAILKHAQDMVSDQSS